MHNIPHLNHDQNYFLLIVMKYLGVAVFSTWSWGRDYLTLEILNNYEWIINAGSRKSKEYLAKLDCGLDQSPTSMVGDKNNNNNSVKIGA